METRKQAHLPIDQILVDENKYQFRAAVSLEVAENYATLIGEGQKFPNIVLFDTKREDSKYVLVEGFQRYKAYQVNNYRKLHVDIIEGSEEEAIEFAMKSNATHGAQYTREDKRKILRYIFGHSKLKRSSDNSIAKRYGFSQGFVSSYRKQYETERGIEDENRVKMVSTKDGREYPIDSKKGAETRKKNGNDKNTRRKPVIPEVESITISSEILPTQLELGDSIESETIVDTLNSSIRYGSTYSNDLGSVKVTFDELNKVKDLPGAFNLIIYSSDLDWLIENQALITTNPNVIVQGHTGEDINKIQNIDTLANTFNLFVVAGRMTVTAYFCSTSMSIKDRVIESYEGYLTELVKSYTFDSDSKILLVDPSSNVVEIMQNIGRFVHVFYSEKSHGLCLNELEDCELLEIGLELTIDPKTEENLGHFDTEVF